MSQTRLYFWLQVAGLVEGEAVVVAVVGHPRPAGRPGLGPARRSGRPPGLVAAHAGELAVARQAEDRLDREVGVVGQVAGEVVGAELVLGVEAVLLAGTSPTW